MKNKDYETGYNQCSIVLKTFGATSTISAIDNMYDAQLNIYNNLNRSEFDNKEEYESRKNYLSGYLDAIEKYLNNI